MIVPIYAKVSVYSIILRAAYNILNSWTFVVEIHVFHITTVNDYQSVSSTTLIRLEQEKSKT
jgi:hypothetical protein